MELQHSFVNGIQVEKVRLQYEQYKKDTTAELYGAFGYFSEIDLEKKVNLTKHSLKPKFLLRYSPGSMRKLEDADISRLDPDKAFDIDRLDNIIKSHNIKKETTKTTKVTNTPKKSK